MIRIIDSCRGGPQVKKCPADVIGVGLYSRRTVGNDPWATAPKLSQIRRASPRLQASAVASAASVKAKCSPCSQALTASTSAPNALIYSPKRSRNAGRAADMAPLNRDHVVYGPFTLKGG